MTLQQSKHWQIHPPAPDAFLSGVPEHPLLAQVLYNRGVRTPEDVTQFLTVSDLVVDNPYRLRDMVPAVQRILQAIETGEIICVYGDFDADGVTATALLVNALQAAGARVGSYIPDRVDEGYGLNLDAITRIARQAGLMVTVDCGIRSVAEVQHARELGLDVIVTDHHSVGAHLPPGLAVINPRRADCPSKFAELAGVGVAYRLAQAVLRAAAHRSHSALTPEQAAELEHLLLDFVALGTVADMMPLLGENRSLVQRGLAQLNATARPGLRALMDVAGLRPGDVDATAISFRLGPRINAAGRLSQTALAYKLLRTNDAQEGLETARHLEELNTQRRTLTDSALAEAERQLAAQLADAPPLYFVASERFQPGIVGLVAGKLANRFYRPAVVVEQGETESRGSARSIPEVDISAALDSVSDLLVRHGGHSSAAGFTVATANLPSLHEALGAQIHAALDGDAPLRPTLEIDADVPFDQLDWALVEQFARLEPMGQDNPQPLLLCRNVRVREARAVGKGKHLKLAVDMDRTSRVLDAIAFDMGRHAADLGDGSRIDVVFSLEVNVWNERRLLQLNVQDLRADDGGGASGSGASGSG
ncbi:MAG: single-stranded-DNA-specific exonuclease RecJ [Caldilineaceae bacterium]|nr:single-stranded-DNA-specific exonuclease RecJ [Caldilineaceae bacterium]